MEETYRGILEKLKKSRRLKAAPYKESDRSHPLIQALLELIHSDKFRYGLSMDNESIRFGEDCFDRLKYLNTDLFGRFSLTRLNARELEMIKSIIQDPSLEERLMQDEVIDSVSSNNTDNDIDSKLNHWKGVAKKGVVASFLLWASLTPLKANAQVYSDAALTKAVQIIQTSNYTNIINEEVARFNAEHPNFPVKIKPEWIQAMAYCESSYNPEAKSDKGAKGMLQVTRITTEELAKHFPEVPKNIYDRDDMMFNPRISIQLGIRNLALNLGWLTKGTYKGTRPVVQSIESFEDKLMLSFAGYNEGGYGVIHKMMKHRRETGDDAISYSDMRKALYKEARNYAQNNMNLINKIKAYKGKYAYQSDTQRNNSS